MSTPERAPEPTMDEILASIRRIIADEDAPLVSESRPFGSSLSSSSLSSFGGGLRAKQTESISKPQGFDADRLRPGDDEDDILDLTKVLAERSYEEPAIETAVKAEPAGETGPLTVEELDRALAEVAMAIDQDMTAAEQPGGSAFEVDDVVAATAAGDKPAEPQADPALSGPMLQSTREDIDPESLSWDEETVATDPPVESRFDNWPSEAQQTLAERMGMGSISATPTPPEPVKTVLDDTPKTPPMPGLAQPVAATATPNGSAQDHWPTAAAPAPAASTAAVTSSSAKSLEDSIKEMLRPMLREWLDANMMRIVEETMREELGKQDAIQRRH